MIEHNGKMYARVSEILQPYTNFGHIDPEVLDRKCRLGRDLHKAIEADIKGDFPLLASNFIGYFQSYEKWKEQIQPTFVQSEMRYFDDEKMITGQIDCLVKIGYQLDLPVLIDFKTSATEGKETWPMQGHLYSYLLLKNNFLIHPRVHFIQLDKTGKLPKVFEYLWLYNTYCKCMNAIDNFWDKQKVLTKDDKI